MMLKTGVTFFTSLILVVGLPVLAHEDASDPAHSHDEVDVSVNSDDEFKDEGLDSADLSDGVVAEVLPDEKVKFGWENAWFNIRRAFSFSAERKAALDRERLHRLDIKLTACAELGDEECVDKIEDRIVKTEERAEEFIKRRQELRDKLEERFLNWRTERNERLEALRTKAQERKDRLEQLKEERKNKLKELREEKKEETIERRQNIRSSLEQKKDDIKEIKSDVGDRRIEIKSNLNSQDLDTDNDGVVKEVIEKEVTNDSARVKIRQEINAKNNQSVNDRLEVRVNTGDQE